MELSTTTDPDPAISDMASPNSVGDYNDIAALEVSVLSSNEIYEFTIANAGDLVVDSATSGSELTADDTFKLAGADWIPDALIGGTLNPNTDQAVVFKIIDNDETTLTVNTVIPAQVLTDVAADDNPFSITMPTDPADFTTFQLEGLPIEFTLDVEEDNDPVTPAETFALRVGGIIRHLPPSSYASLMGTIHDDVGLDPAINDGDGIPELGETIEIDITLINVTKNELFQTDVDNVVGILDAIGSNIDILGDDDKAFGDINDGNTRTATYRFQIESDFEESVITFALEIKGDFGGSTENLGTDIFVIPVGNGQ